jgi:aryl-alcohol dehydrogenase-like predicted oxidoreductase
MQKRKPGKSGITAAAERGVTLVDTAQIYGCENEEIVGEALERLPR